jgi:hypothetical protein
MEDLLIYFLVLIGTGIVSHFAAMIMLNVLLEGSKTPDEFFKKLLRQVYILCAVVFAAWLIWGGSSILLTAFAFGLFITFLRLDLDSVVDYYEK